MNRGGIVSHISNELQINHFYNVFYKIDQLNFLFLVSFPSAVSFEFIKGDQKFSYSNDCLDSYRHFVHSTDKVYFNLLFLVFLVILFYWIIVDPEI